MNTKIRLHEYQNSTVLDSFFALYGGSLTDAALRAGAGTAGMATERFALQAANALFAGLCGASPDIAFTGGIAVFDTGMTDQAGNSLFGVVRIGENRHVLRFSTASDPEVAASYFPKSRVVGHIRQCSRELLDKRSRIAEKIEKLLSDVRSDRIAPADVHALRNMQYPEYCAARHKLCNALSLLPEEEREALHTLQDVADWLGQYRDADEAAYSLPGVPIADVNRLFRLVTEDPDFCMKHWEQVFFYLWPEVPAVDPPEDKDYQYRVDALGYAFGYTPLGIGQRFDRSNMPEIAARFLVFGLLLRPLRPHCISLLRDILLKRGDFPAVLALYQSTGGWSFQMIADTVRQFRAHNDLVACTAIYRSNILLRRKPEYAQAFVALCDRCGEPELAEEVLGGLLPGSLPEEESKLWNSLETEGSIRLYSLARLIRRLSKQERTGDIAGLFALYHSVLQKSDDLRPVCIRACLTEDVPNMERLIACGLSEALGMLYDKATGLHAAALRRAVSGSQQPEVWQWLLQLEQLLDDPALYSVIFCDDSLRETVFDREITGFTQNAADRFRTGGFTRGPGSAALAERIFEFCGTYLDAAEQVLRFGLDPEDPDDISLLLELMLENSDDAGILALFRSSPLLRENRRRLYIQMLYGNRLYADVLRESADYAPSDEECRIWMLLSRLRTDSRDEALGQLPDLLSGKAVDICRDTVDALRECKETALLCRVLDTCGEDWLRRFPAGELWELFDFDEYETRQMEPQLHSLPVRIRLGLENRRRFSFYEESLAALQEDASDPMQLGLLENLYPEHSRELLSAGLIAELRRIGLTLRDNRTRAEATVQVLGAVSRPDAALLQQMRREIGVHFFVCDPELTRRLIELSRETGTSAENNAYLLSCEATGQEAEREFYRLLFQELRETPALTEAGRSCCIRMAAAQAGALWCLFLDATCTELTTRADMLLGILADLPSGVTEAEGLQALIVRFAAARWPDGVPDAAARFSSAVLQDGVRAAEDWLQFGRQLHLPGTDPVSILTADPDSAQAWSAVRALYADEDPQLRTALLRLSARRDASLWPLCAASSEFPQLHEILAEWAQRCGTEAVLTWIGSDRTHLTAAADIPIAMPVTWDLFDTLFSCPVGSRRELLQIMVDIATYDADEDVFTLLLSEQLTALTERHPSCGIALLCQLLRIEIGESALHLIRELCKNPALPPAGKLARLLRGRSAGELTRWTADEVNRKLLDLLLPDGTLPDEKRLRTELVQCMRLHPESRSEPPAAERADIFIRTLCMLHTDFLLDEPFLWEVMHTACYAMPERCAAYLRLAFTGMLRTGSSRFRPEQPANALAALYAIDTEETGQAGEAVQQLSGISMTECARLNSLQRRIRSRMQESSDPQLYARAVLEQLTGAGPVRPELTLPEETDLLPEAIVTRLMRTPEAGVKAFRPADAAQARALSLRRGLHHIGGPQGQAALALPVADREMFPYLEPLCKNSIDFFTLILCCCSPHPEALGKLTRRSRECFAAGHDDACFRLLYHEMQTPDRARFDREVTAQWHISGYLSGGLSPSDAPAALAAGLVVYLQSTPRCREVLRLIACFPQELQRLTEAVRSLYLTGLPGTLPEDVTERYLLLAICADAPAGVIPGLDSAAAMLDDAEQALQKAHPEADPAKLRTFLFGGYRPYPGFEYQRDPAEFDSIRRIELPPFARDLPQAGQTSDRLRAQLRMAESVNDWAACEQLSRSLLSALIAAERPASQQYTVLTACAVYRYRYLEQEHRKAEALGVLRELAAVPRPDLVQHEEVNKYLRRIISSALPALLLSSRTLTEMTQDYTAHKAMYDTLTEALVDDTAITAFDTVFGILTRLSEPVARFNADRSSENRQQLLRAFSAASDRMSHLMSDQFGLYGGLKARIARMRSEAELHPELELRVFDEAAVYPSDGLLSGQITNCGGVAAADIQLHAVFSSECGEAKTYDQNEPRYVLPWLEPGETATFEIPYRTASGCDRLHCTLRAECRTPDNKPVPPHSQQYSLPIGYPEELPEQLPFNAEKNVQIRAADPETGEPVTKRFVGRTRQKERLRRLVSEPEFSDCRSALIYGFRRIGKTTLLFYLREYIHANRKKDILCVYVNAQMTGTAIQELFVKPVLQQLPLCRELKQEWSLPDGELRDPHTLPAFFQAAARAAGRGIYLMIDEFDRVAGLPEHAVTMQVLAGMIEDPDCRSAVHFVICGSKWLLRYESTGDSVDQFSQRFGDNRIEVDALTRPDIDELLHSVPMKLTLPDETVERIWRYTGGMAWYAMLFANKAVERIIEGQRCILCPSDVDDVIYQVLSDTNCRQFTEGCPERSTEMRILRLMAENANRRDKEIPLALMQRELDVSAPELQRALDMLCRLRLICMPRTDRYAFALESIRLYLRVKPGFTSPSALGEQEVRMRPFRG